MKITCPQCGSNIELQPRSVQLTCPFCNTPLIFEKEPSLECYRIEPTCEKEPTIAIIKQFLRERNRTEEIIKTELIYLPFYRFLYEKKGRIVEKVFSAMHSPPFLFLTIPSGTMVPLEDKNKEIFMKPEKKLSLILEKMKDTKTKALEEILLLYLPFWKAVISSGETIWCEGVQGRIVTTNLTRVGERTGKILKSVLTVVFILLLIEGLTALPLLSRFLLQGISTTVFVYFFLKKFKYEY